MTSPTQQSGSNDWSTYYRATQERPPRPLLIKALEHVINKNRAIDIGAGALSDTRYLLSLGFKVTAIDKSPLLSQLATPIQSDNLTAVVTSYEEFDFGTNNYDIASAFFALPFNPPETFNQVFENIKQSLVPGGIFVGQFFGVHDGWSTNKEMSFHTREEIESLLNGMEIIQIVENEEDGVTAAGNPKHWHLFHVIARKK